MPLGAFNPRVLQRNKTIDNRRSLRFHRDYLPSPNLITPILYFYKFLIKTGLPWDHRVLWEVHRRTDKGTAGPVSSSTQCAISRWKNNFGLLFPGQGKDATLSSHPFSNRTIIPASSPMGESWSLAMVGYRYMYHGKAAHAAAAPEAGINALNAVIHLFTGIDALRQRLRDDVRIHGVVTDGGTAPNVAPEFAAANFMLRSKDGRYLSDVVVCKVRQVAEGAASMTGARLEVQEFYPFYENVQPNVVPAQAVGANSQALEIRLDEPVAGRAGSGASTDFGNVSQVMPALELRYAVSEEPVASHTRDMCETAVTNLALSNALLVAKALSLTASDLLRGAAMVEAAKAEFAGRSG